MHDDEPSPGQTKGEPAPLVMFGVAIIPILLVAGYFLLR